MSPLCKKWLIYLLCALAGGAVAACASNDISSAWANADLVLVAEPTVIVMAERHGTVELSARRVVKGPEPQATSVIATVSPELLPRELMEPGKRIQAPVALWFLKQTPEGIYTVLERGAPASSRSAAPFPFLKAATRLSPQIQSNRSIQHAGDSFPSALLWELAAAVEEFDSDRGAAWAFYGLVFANMVAASELQNLDETLVRWSNSQSPHIRGLALATQAKLGRPGSIVHLEQQIRALVGSAARPLISAAVSDWHALFREDVEALGRLVVSPRPDPSWAIDRSAVYALRSVHSRDAVPYLVKALDSPDGVVREDAVAGLGAFAVGFPVFTDSLTMRRALDRAFNPGYRGADRISIPDPDIRKHFHMGLFANREEETRIIAFWRAWASKNGF